MNRALTGPNPAESLYQATDGWLAIAVRGAAMAGRFAQALALDTVLTSPAATWGEAERAAIQDAIATLPCADLARRLTEAGIWFERCDPDRREAAMADPALQATGIVLRTSDRRYGDFRQIGPAFRFGRTALAFADRGAIPERGEHNRDILRLLGYTDAEIDGLIAEKIVA